MQKKNAELLLATDPDCDRVSMEVLDNNNKYIMLSGNITGALLVNYILESMKEKGTLNNQLLLLSL